MRCWGTMGSSLSKGKSNLFTTNFIFVANSFIFYSGNKYHAKNMPELVLHHLSKNAYQLFFSNYIQKVILSRKVLFFLGHPVITNHCESIFRNVCLYFCNIFVPFIWNSSNRVCWRNVVRDTFYVCNIAVVHK